MKKSYQKLTMWVISIQHSDIICASVNSSVNNVGLNEEIIGGSGTARSRDFNVWDDEWDWEGDE